MCAWCGGLLDPGARSDRRTCSPRCRVALSRDRCARRERDSLATFEDLVREHGTAEERAAYAALVATVPAFRETHGTILASLEPAT
ncbi:hypothetical protein GCM10011519_33750 [Marmoricola endophyticus]|uniref:Uncharacterized protein n=1 Tax=Marmoricola endophyticus TaxID=2040280 RepID=A0A917BSE6_9ACTN|nr:hypothetical protein GCM10011519_33750 [Marmoricola endophyticus]